MNDLVFDKLTEHENVDAELIKEAIGDNIQVLYQHECELDILRQSILDRYSLPRNATILAIVLGYTDVCLDEIAALHSIYSGYDGHDNIKDGYRNILKVFFSRWNRDFTSFYHKGVAEVLYRRPVMIEGIGWLLICDVGICFWDIRSRQSVLLEWDEVCVIGIDDETIRLNEFETYFPRSQFLSLSLRDAIVRLVIEMVRRCGCTCEIMNDNATDGRHTD